MDKERFLDKDKNVRERNKRNIMGLGKLSRERFKAIIYRIPMNELQLSISEYLARIFRIYSSDPFKILKTKFFYILMIKRLRDYTMKLFLVVKSGQI